MRYLVALMLIVTFAIGCAKPQAETQKQQGSSKQVQDHLAEAIQYLKEGEGVEAIKSFDQAIKQDPMNPQAYMVLGQVYLQMQDFNRAIDTFSAAARVAPQSGEAQYFLAMSYGLSGEKDKAVASAQKSIQFFQASKDEENFIRSLALLQGLLKAGSPHDGQALDNIQDIVSEKDMSSMVN